MSLSRELHKLPAKLASTYELQHKLGFGSFAMVYQVRNRMTNELLALKVVDKLPLEQRMILDTLQKEVKLLQLHGDAPNVVRLRQFMEAEGRFFLFFDLCGKNLMDHVSGRPASEPQALEWAHQACEALVHLHSAGVIHRDLKPANLLMCPGGEIRICDFGYAAYEHERPNDPAGTREYAAPEVMNMQHMSNGLPQTTAADIYSLGTCIQHFLLGRIPNGPHDIPSNASAEMKQLLHAMLQVNPALRPTAEDLLEQLEPNEPGLFGQVMAYFNLGSIEEEHHEPVKMGPSLSTASTMTPSIVTPTSKPMPVMPRTSGPQVVSAVQRPRAASSGPLSQKILMVPSLVRPAMVSAPSFLGHRRMRSIS
mmetsp:Transcript_22060/g.50402  ORF Transcript_22060/g.50402 Transcript_22060/m.50402 type:complete len:366 (-) Transcript_22060:52-1149(-)